jgi:serine/threonine-protein kinase PknG
MSSDPATAAGPPCGEPHCTGTIGATGLCTVCGFRPPGADDVTVVQPPEPARPASVLPESTPPESIRPDSVPHPAVLAESEAITVVSAGESGTLPELAVPEPASRILVNPRVPERHRHCGTCGGPVGRTVAGNPGPTEGFCPSCGAGFSLSPKLHEGDLVAGQYEVVGCVARAGWAGSIWPGTGTSATGMSRSKA